MSLRWSLILFGRPSKVKRYILMGALMGLVFGILEAFVGSVNDPDPLGRMSINFGQFGFACPFFGGVLGYIVAKRLERRRARRLADGHCGYCGYDLTGNVSGVCPECGERI